MPFSWKKKTRCTRFSQLVADHLQSPKRGGSLVVETGFPTSLIDLYVRNRGRFRKSSAKKPRGNESPTLLSTSTSSSSGLSVVDPHNISSRASDYTEIDEIIEEDVVVVVPGGGIVTTDGEIEIENSNSSKSEVETSAEMPKLNPVFVAALKVLFIVVLALGAKRFTVGITLSAFLLLFLESVGKPLLGRSSLIRPSVDSKDSKTQFESGFHETQNIKFSKQKNTTLVVCSEVLEIEEQVESKEEVRSEKDSDESRSEVSMEISHKTSRRAILKSRMKKLVPKKLHKSSMASKDRKSLPTSSESSDSKVENLCVSKQEQDQIVEIEGRSSSSTFSSEIHSSDKDLGRESKQKSGYLALCLIVLIGLIEGRVLALVLALLWCLLLKNSHWRNVKFSIS